MTAGDITAAAGAAVTILTTIGAVGRFVWNKIEARFELIERELEDCRKRGDLSDRRRGVLITIIELLKQEFRHHLPEKSEALSRADELMEEYHSLKPDAGKEI